MSNRRVAQRIWSPTGAGMLLVVAILGVGLYSVGQFPRTARAASIAPDKVAGHQTTEKLVVTVGLDGKSAGTLELRISDDKGNVVASRESQVNSGQGSKRFDLPALQGNPERFTLHCRLGSQEFDVPLKKVLVVKAHETSVTATKEFLAGSDGSLLCDVHAVKSYSETIPLAGASVIVQLVGTDGKVYPLQDSRTGSDGQSSPSFKVPDVTPGQYTLEVTTRSDLGSESLTQTVQVKSSRRVMLVTDKPLYQPGQVIHIRALCLNATNLGPVADKDIVLEVEDSKGNKVFKKPLRTSAYGIASADFQLADEVNMGDYHVRATLGELQSDKTVSVQRYVLPKFKLKLDSDKKYYQPRETLKATLQADYFFGKPIANAKVKLTASTFDVQFRVFHTWEGKTDANGHVAFEVTLPEYFVGQPIQKGDALVRLEAEITDTAEHTETVGKNYPVSDRPIRVSLIPEGGRLVPEIANRVFAAATYPDGSPAPCAVKLWTGRQAKGDPVATIKTNAAGLAEFQVTPKAEQLRQAAWITREVEMIGGSRMAVMAPRILFDLFAEAKDAAGITASAVAEVTTEPLGENVLLRLDRAIYLSGQKMKLDIRTSAGLPTVYFDVVREGQTLLTKWLDVKDGKAEYDLDLPADLFGTLEVHAYQPLGTGEIIRDSRVVYVQPATDLKINVTSDQELYKPGQEGSIRFQVTDAAGKPTAAALGVIVVDEAVYALQEMQPGLEKVYFTLQQELLKPQAQAVFKPAEGIDQLVRQTELPPEKQQVAQALLTAVRVKPPAKWQVNPVYDRQSQIQQQVFHIGAALYAFASQRNDFMKPGPKAGEWNFVPDLLQQVIKAGHLNAVLLRDPFGQTITLEDLTRTQKGFTPEQLATAITFQRMNQLFWSSLQYARQHVQQLQRNNKWVLPDTLLQLAIKNQGIDALWLKDGWGQEIRLMKRDPARKNTTGQTEFDEYEIVSAGPDGKFGTRDDVGYEPQRMQNFQPYYWWSDTKVQLATWGRFDGFQQGRFGGFGPMGGMARRDYRLGMPMAAGVGGMPPPAPAGPGGFGGGGGMPGAGAPPMADAGAVPLSETASAPGGDKGGAAPISRVREYFPETLLWQPALITDDEGRASLPLSFADSITTWRLTASASSRGGALGGTTTALRVFQDFFVDLDLPVSLTQNDEVAFPVAVYNYLKEPQTLKIELQHEPWFVLADESGLTRTLNLKPGEVTSVKFRIRALRIGLQPLMVKATGSRLSDAVKRVVEVVPDGKRVEQVVSDRLTAGVTHTITVPDGSVPDASKLIVKIYPGVFCQVMEGLDGILRLPGGCFEQTSSSAYPNVLAVDYIKKSRTANPELLMKAENFLNVGYQRLLTFERPGGGFDWWGSGEPLVWLSAYGLQQFNDMSKVYPVDRGIIDRTQAWLMKQREADGTWSKIGATHGESIERMGDPKLLLTSYVVWALADTGLKSPELEKSVAYIRTHARNADNAYILALAANALAAWDPKDDSTLELLQKLEKVKQPRPEWKAVCFPAGGQSLTYARGESMTVETTALTVLAMSKTTQFTNSINQGLAYLMKARDSSGTWGSTQATILALKALVAGQSGPKQESVARFQILVDGKPAAKGEVTPENSDVLQVFDLKDYTHVGDHQVQLQVEGETNLMYQVVGRYFEPWKPAEEKKPVLTVDVSYDRTRLTTSDLLHAKATLKYTGEVPTFMVFVDLGIPPGFTVDPGEFAEMVGAKQITKFTVTSRQVTLYVGDVNPGDVRAYEYTLKPKYPIRAKTPATVAYEGYTPSNRAVARPVELTVTEKAAKE